MKYLRSLIITYLVTTIFAVQADFASRLEKIEHACKDIKKSPDVNLGLIAAKLQDAHIDTFIQHVVQKNIESPSKTFTMDDCYGIADDIKFGPIKHDHRSAADLKSTCYHEVGHAVVGAFTQGMVVTRVNVDRRVDRGGIMIPVSAHSKDYHQGLINNMIPMFLAGGLAQEICNERKNHSHEDGLKKIFLRPGCSGISNKLIFKFLSIKNLKIPSIEDYLMIFHTIAWYYDVSGNDVYLALDDAQSIVRSKKIPGVMMFAASSLLCVHMPIVLPSLLAIAGCAALLPDRPAQKEILLESYAQAEKVILENQDKIKILAEELYKNKKLSGQRIYDALGRKKPQYWFEKFLNKE